MVIGLSGLQQANHVSTLPLSAYCKMQKKIVTFAMAESVGKNRVRLVAIP